MTTVVESPMVVAEVMAVSRRSRNYVCDAVNSGMLESLPRHGKKHQFTAAMVQRWIDAGSPRFPHKPTRRRTGGAA
ncbi:MAG: hypothetical protein QM658_14260 [Gordonia sp. (in: high G+C Gram-positive bacteria)]